MKKFTVVICNPTEPIGLGQKVYGGVVSAAYDRELTDEKPAVAHPPIDVVRELYEALELAKAAWILGEGDADEEAAYHKVNAALKSAKEHGI